MLEDAFDLARFALTHSQGLLNGHGTPDYAILVGWQPFAHYTHGTCAREVRQIGVPVFVIDA